MWNGRVRALVAAFCILVPAFATAGDLVPVEAFAHHANYSLPKLSPDGKYLAVAVEQNDEHAVVVYQLDDMSTPKSALKLPKYELAGDIHWAGSERLVIELAKFVGSIDRPQWMGEIIAVDVDGRRVTPIFSQEWTEGPLRGNERPADEGYAVVAGLPAKANDHIYMQTYMWDDENTTSLYDVNANNGVRHLIGQINMKRMQFTLDSDGNVRYAAGLNNSNDYVLYRKDGNQWTQLETRASDVTIQPIKISQDKQHLYTYSNTKLGPASLVDMSLDGSHSTVLAKDDFGDIDYVQWGPQGQPIAASAATGIPNAVMLDSNQPLAKLYAGLSKKFSNDFIDFSSFSEDGNELVFKAISDRNPGAYYLFDIKRMTIKKLFSENAAIDPNKMGSRAPMRFKANDGTMLEAILTVPAGASMDKLPMVLLPHGGPFDESDTWFFDSDAQFLASRGYLVLQVNFRGSGDRGPAFEQSGYGQWGTRIQQDLIDGVKWAEDQHYADPARVCVYGASFGGYAAMMSVIRAQGMFKCAIGYAGIYDLGMMYDKGSIKDGEFGKNYLKQAIGDDPAKLAANSPDKLADNINVPVLLIHGEADQRVPFAQAKAMRAALDTAHKPYEWLTKSDEGHGFYNEKNIADMYSHVQTFLEKNIGPGVKPN